MVYLGLNSGTALLSAVQGLLVHLVIRMHGAPNIGTAEDVEDPAEALLLYASAGERLSRHEPGSLRTQLRHCWSEFI